MAEKMAVEKTGAEKTGAEKTGGNKPPAEKLSWLRYVPRGWAFTPFLLVPVLLVLMIVGPLLGMPKIIAGFLAPVLAVDFVVALLVFDFTRSARKR